MQSLLGFFHVFMLVNAVSVTSRDSPDDPSSSECDALMQTPLRDIPVQPFPAFDASLAQVFRYRQHKSVNMGSWFVHEAWMTPSLFTWAAPPKISELNIAAGWNCTACARRVLENHWDTFIDDTDFSYLSSIGINTVRLPIGYWSLGPKFCQDTPFAPFADVYHNAWSFVVRAINMAAEHHIGVLVDMHGAVGSQNGEPHSGVSDRRAGLFSNASNMDKTITALKYLTQQLCNVTNVIGVQILNEPSNSQQLPDFYNRAISEMSTVPSAARFPFYIHDAFNLKQFSDFNANRTDFVVVDHHSYFVFTPADAKKPASQHTQDIKTSIKSELAAASAHQHGKLIIGEWSCALTEQSLSSEPDEEAARQEFCTAQLNTYSTAAAGWSFWSYKLESCATSTPDPGWCFPAAVGRFLPSNFSSYRNGCNPQKNDELLRRSDATALTHHRLAAIHYEREKRASSGMTAEQKSEAQGYADGWGTAGVFCESGGSKLGFIDQYIKDTYGRTDGGYLKGFYEGLSEGEQSMM